MVTESNIYYIAVCIMLTEFGVTLTGYYGNRNSSLQCKRFIQIFLIGTTQAKHL